jgi:hypothetical protein
MGSSKQRFSAGAVGWLRSRFVWLLLLAGIVLLFADLSDVYLWQDEAETAVIARHVLTYGLPLSTDGRDWVQQSSVVFQEFNHDYIWTYHPWLQYLLTAGSFAVLGVTTSAARFPFVLTGLLTLLASYYFVSRWVHDSLTAPVAGLLLLLCVPFILLVRQCRYFAPSALFTLLTLDSYLWLRSDKPWAVPYFVLSAVLLFHSFYGAFFPTLAALAVHMLLSQCGRWLLACAARAKGKGNLPEASSGDVPSVALGGTRLSLSAWLDMPAVRFLFALLLIGVLTLPWTTLIPVSRGGSSVVFAAKDTAQRLATDATAATEPRPSAFEFGLRGLGQYFLYVSVWVFPLIVGLGWLIASLLSRRTGPRLSNHMSSGRPSGWRAPRTASGAGDERQPDLGGTEGPAAAARPAEQERRRDRAAFFQVVGSVIVANIIALCAFYYMYFRYLAHILPLLLAMLAVAVVWFIERWRVVGYALLLLLVTSNGLHVLPYMLFKAAVPPESHLWQEVWSSPATEWIYQIRAVRLHSDQLMYGQELTHSYQGPNEGLVAYLSVYATPGQTVLVNYEDLPLEFYTNLRVLGGLAAHGLTPDLRPDWVIDRKYGPYRDLLAGILAAGSYERITLPAPDITWENREEPGRHHYLTEQDEDPVTLYRLQGG